MTFTIFSAAKKIIVADSAISVILVYMGIQIVKRANVIDWEQYRRLAELMLLVRIHVIVMILQANVSVK